MPSVEELVQQARDRDHLRILEICHYVYAAMQSLGVLFGLMYVAFGLAMGVAGAAAISTRPAAPPAPSPVSPAEAAPPAEPDDAGQPDDALSDADDGAPSDAAAPADQGASPPAPLVPTPAANPPPEAMLWMIGGMFALIGGGVAVFSGIVAGLHFFAARSLARRTNRMLCFVAAGLACMNMPLGTLLGVFTFVVLLRPSVEALFRGETWPPEKPPEPAVPA